MKKQIVNAVSVLLLSLVATAAMAEQCKAVHARMGDMIFHDPGCMLGGVTYYWCAERPSMGTLEGTYRLYSAPATNGWDLEVPTDAVGASWWMGVAYAISVFETPKGTLFTQETGVWHYDSVAGWGAHFSITGGTGHYNGATGWLAGAGSWDTMVLVGELCTP